MFCRVLSDWRVMLSLFWIHPYKSQKANKVTHCSLMDICLYDLQWLSSFSEWFKCNKPTTIIWSKGHVVLENSSSLQRYKVLILLFYVPIPTFFTLKLFNTFKYEAVIPSLQAIGEEVNLYFTFAFSPSLTADLICTSSVWNSFRCMSVTPLGLGTPVSPLAFHPQPES